MRQQGQSPAPPSDELLTVMWWCFAVGYALTGIWLIAEAANGDIHLFHRTETGPTSIPFTAAVLVIMVVGAILYLYKKQHPK